MTFEKICWFFRFLFQVFFVGNQVVTVLVPVLVIIFMARSFVWWAPVGSASPRFCSWVADNKWCRVSRSGRVCWKLLKFEEMDLRPDFLSKFEETVSCLKALVLASRIGFDFHKKVTFWQLIFCNSFWPKHGSTSPLLSGLLTTSVTTKNPTILQDFGRLIFYQTTSLAPRGAISAPDQSTFAWHAQDLHSGADCFGFWTDNIDFC